VARHHGHDHPLLRQNTTTTNLRTYNWKATKYQGRRKEEGSE